MMATAAEPSFPPRPRSAGIRVVDHVVDLLAAAGVSHVFGVDGANIEDLYDAAHFCPDITAVLAKHEFSAATMADGFSRATAQLGVVAATSGGGALNLVAGLGESYASRVPVLALVGQSPTSLDGRGGFQDTSGRNGSLDAEALFSAVSVYSRRIIDPDDIRAALPEAVAAARAGGPAVLLLPKDVQQATVPTNGVVRVNGRRRCAEDAEPILRALHEASGPVTIIAGEQVARDDARGELERLRVALHARIATVPDAKDVSRAPMAAASLGVTGVMGHPGVADALRTSAVCLLVGTRLSVTARAGLDEALRETCTLSIGSTTPYVPSIHLHTNDLRASLAELTRRLTNRPRWEVAAVDSTSPAELTPPTHRGPGIRYREAISALDALLPDDADIVVDAGNSGAAAIHHLPARRDGRFVVALGMGGMGYSFGAGIGMAFARRRRTVIVAGDGSFFMHGLELHTAIQHRLPVTLVLFNNNAHAMCVTREKLYYTGRYTYNRFTESNLGAGLAAMFPGLPAVDISDPDALGPALRRALEADGPSVVTVECSADEIPPFAPFLDHDHVSTHHRRTEDVIART
ncbi:thiamine pyrophosphate-binding protein [Mycolicibacterium confluentis]|uniref:thiamine pyrophosphate-binding protein n=1 Tax=Mycolicibacterium confluentis TaxID=28047 RepID=UPI000A162927|nr:thiamine pyrophosphate-binding protein [Mycolicibacterium confluentis]MCV7322167.1 thiamine pyrophosphate-binding protein [Mycolicibacterium confluentis]